MNTELTAASPRNMDFLSQVDFTDLSQWKTFDEIEQKYPYFKKSTLKWMFRNKDRNGLDKIIKKVGQFNMVHVPAFSLWISQQ